MHADFKKVLLSKLSNKDAKDALIEIAELLESVFDASDDLQSDTRSFTEISNIAPIAYNVGVMEPSLTRIEFILHGVGLLNIYEQQQIFLRRKNDK